MSEKAPFTEREKSGLKALAFSAAVIAPLVWVGVRNPLPEGETRYGIVAMEAAVSGSGERHAHRKPYQEKSEFNPTSDALRDANR